MTHYCPACHRRLPSNPADTHVCLTVVTSSPAPDPTQRIDAPPPSPVPTTAQRVRRALIEGFCHVAWVALLVGFAYLIVWGNPPY